MFALSNAGDWTHEPRQMCMVWDFFNDEPERFYKGGVVGPLEDAMKHIENYYGSAGRFVVIKCDVLWPVPTQQRIDRLTKT